MLRIIWTEYLQYRAELRRFNLENIERILRNSTERYYDTETQRAIVVGKYEGCLVIIPYEQDRDTITPITIHTTTRQQVQFRLKNGRFILDD